MQKILILIVSVMLLEHGTALAGPPNIEMVLVKGSCYQMGDSFGDGDEDEKPVHKACVDDFYIGKYEVTQAQYQEVMGTNPSEFKGDNRPVETVSWDEAKAFTLALQKATGKQYRLPTEAEWEYAARSGGKQELFAGTSDQRELGDYAWHGDNSDEQTHPVGRLKPNSLGLYDMSGNVWEWCRDYYDAKYYGESSELNPPGPISGENRVKRGGSWGNAPSSIQAANRNKSSSDFRRNNLGFRLVLPSSP